MHSLAEQNTTTREPKRTPNDFNLSFFSLASLKEELGETPADSHHFKY